MANYIHTYKFNEAVKDQVILDLRYEAREIEQNLESEQAVDQLLNTLHAILVRKQKRS